MRKPKVLVIGSANMDLIIEVSRFPAIGETVDGRDFRMCSGGKGAIQAIAAARMGGDVTFLSRIGNDKFGQMLIEAYMRDEICTQHIIRDNNNSTGVASITIDDNRENKIVVAEGANGLLSADDIRGVETLIAQSDIILTQYEIPLVALDQILKLAWKYAKKVIINPAPAKEIPFEYFPYIYVMTPSESEIEVLTSIKVWDSLSARRSARILLERGVQHVVILRGKKGIFYKSADREIELSAPQANTFDNSGDSDSFNGALAVFMKECESWEEALERSMHAASLSASK